MLVRCWNIGYPIFQTLPMIPISTYAENPIPYYASAPKYAD